MFVLSVQKTVERLLFWKRANQFFVSHSSSVFVRSNSDSENNVEDSDTEDALENSKHGIFQPSP